MALIDRRLYVALLLHRSKVYAAVASRDSTVQEVQYRKQLKRLTQKGPRRGREGAEKIDLRGSNEDEGGTRLSA
jgi:hypothetical protein